MALGYLVLSCRDSLLLDARSTVPTEEVACLRYAALPSSSGIFPTPLLDSALTKMRAASNALAQQTLHPSKILRKSSAGPSKARFSSASSADWRCFTGCSMVAAAGFDYPILFLIPAWSEEGVVTRVRLPFQGPPAAPEVNEKGLGRNPPDKVSPLLRVGGCLSVHWRHWQTLGASSWVLSPSWTLLPSLAPRYRFRRTGQDLFGHWLCTRRSRRCCPRMP